MRNVSMDHRRYLPEDHTLPSWPVSRASESLTKDIKSITRDQGGLSFGPDVTRVDHITGVTSLVLKMWGKTLPSWLVQWFRCEV